MSSIYLHKPAEFMNRIILKKRKEMVDIINKYYEVDDLKDATKYERERYGKRDFKNGSPLHPGKGATIMKKEGILSQLKKDFGETGPKLSILNENTEINENN